MPGLVSTRCGICEVKVNFSAHERARAHAANTPGCWTIAHRYNILTTELVARDTRERGECGKNAGTRRAFLRDGRLLEKSSSPKLAIYLAIELLVESEKLPLQRFWISILLRFILHSYMEKKKMLYQ